MEDFGLTSLVQSKFKNNKTQLEIAQFFMDNIENSTSWNHIEAHLNYCLKYPHRRIGIEEFKRFLDDSDINNFLSNQVLKNKRVTIRKIISNLDATLGLNNQELKAIETLSKMIDNQESIENKTVYIQYNSNIRFDNKHKEFDNITNKTPQEVKLTIEELYANSVKQPE